MACTWEKFGILRVERLNLRIGGEVRGRDPSWRHFSPRYIRINGFSSRIYMYIYIYNSWTKFYFNRRQSFFRPPFLIDQIGLRFETVYLEGLGKKREKKKRKRFEKFARIIGLNYRGERTWKWIKKEYILKSFHFLNLKLFGIKSRRFI